MVKRIIVIFIIITSMDLFSFVFLPQSLIKIGQFAGAGIAALAILLQLIYHKGDHFRHYFKWEILLILASVFLSMLMAYSTYNQSIPTSIVAQRFMYFYLVYFALHQIKIPDFDLERIIIYLGVVYALFYILQFIAYPTKLFDIRMTAERGTIRIFQLGLSYLIIAYFLTLNKIFKEFTPVRIALLLLFFSIFILMGTRQLLASMSALTLVNIMLSKQVKSKVLIIVLIIAAIFPIAMVFQEVFINLMNLSQEQSNDFEENIRILGATFFLTEFFPNNIAYLTGNGADSANSAYGVMIQMYKDVYGFYQSDVGIIGDFSKFGTFFLLGVVLIIVKALRAKVDSSLIYIKYFFVSVVLTSFTGGGFFGEANAIVAVCILLYLIDIQRHRQLEEEEEEEEEEDEEAVDQETNEAWPKTRHTKLIIDK